MFDSVSIVVPVYNSAATLPTLVCRLSDALSFCTRRELILVNDGSADGSWKAIESLCTEYPELRGVDLMRNYGQHSALLAGIRQARYPVIVTIDDDLQHPPEEIAKLISRLAEGFDVVYGTPKHEQHGLFRDAASRITKAALHVVMGVEEARHVSAFRAFRSEVRNAFVNFDGPYVNIDVLLSWGTRRFSAVPVEHNPRNAGTSNYRLRGLVRHTLNMVTGFSVIPLRVATLTGFALTLFGAGVLVYVVYRYFNAPARVPGFAFLASIISIFSGAQLCALGVVGEYLSRMYFRAMGVPFATIRQVTGGGDGV